MRITLEMRLILYLPLMCVGAIMIFCIVSSDAHATTWTVDDDGGEDFTRIQQAIDAASSGDTIRVYEGWYLENVDVEKSLTIIGNGSQDTIIDGGRRGSVVSITSDDVELSRFMITGSSDQEGGIKVQSDKNRIFENLCWENYYGIYLEECEDNIILDNTCSYNEYQPSNYGIYLYSSNQNTLTDNTCTFNRYGIKLRDSNDNTLSENNCSDNEDIGIYIEECKDNTLSDNTCTSNSDYGIHLAGTSRNTLKRNHLEENDIYITGDLRSWNTNSMDTTNTVNGKPLRFFKNSTGITVPSAAGQVILANCTQTVVENQGHDQKSTGILVGFSSNIIIRNNSCSNRYYGIGLIDSEYCTITNNNCSYNNVGIFIDGPDNNIINNTCMNNNKGISIEISNYNNLRDNTCSNNNEGIYIYYSRNCNVENNTCSNNNIGIHMNYQNLDCLLDGNTLTSNIEHGIYLEHSESLKLTDNRLMENEIYIDGNNPQYWNTHIIDTTNTVNGKPIRYYRNIDFITVPSGAGQVILASCTQMVVEDQGHDQEGTGILVGYSSNVTIRNNTCSNRYYGIYLYESEYGTIEENICSNNFDGLYLRNSDHNTLNENTCSNIGNYGISLYYSSDNTLSGNQLMESIIFIWGSTPEDWNTHGIDITNTVNGKPVRYYKNSNGISVPSGAGQVILASCTDVVVENQGHDQKSLTIHVGHSSSITIRNNTCSNNIKYGIRVTNSDHINVANNTNSNNSWGITIQNTDHSMITNNTCSNNSGTGISFSNSYENTLSDNIASNNGGSGISMFRADQNILTNNTCTNNRGNAGIELTMSTNNSISRGTISGCEIGILFKADSPDNIVYFNNIFNNTNYGIASYYSLYQHYTVDAVKNWWGHASGPYHPVNNSEGKGEYVSSNILFDPWLKEIISTPTIAFIDTISPNPALEGLKIDFNGQGSGKGNIVQCAWRSNIDGEFYNDTEPHCSSDSLSIGEHIIYFKVQDERGNWSDEVTLSLNITEMPLAEIESMAPNPALDTGNILFIGNGTDDGTIERYDWRTDDIDLYNGTNSEFSYADFSSGTYTIHLKVQDNHGFWSEEVQETLIVHERPIAIIESITPNPALNTDTINFGGSGTDDGAVERYAWRTNELELYNGTDFDFSFSALSTETYTIYLKVQDNHGVWSDEVSDSLIVHEKSFAIIESISPNPCLENDTINFIGSGTDDGTIDRYVWRSNIDGKIYDDIDDKFYHSSLSTGVHTVYLKVMDNYGIWSDEVQDSLVVNGKPIAIIEEVRPDQLYEGETVSFLGGGYDDGFIVNYSWRSSIDGNIFLGEESYCEKTSLTKGTHTIYLKIQDDQGIWSDEVSTTITVLELEDLPIPQFLNPNNGDTVRGEILVSGSVVTKNREVTEVEISINGGLWYTAIGIDYWSYNWDTDGLRDGQYSILVRSTDGEEYSDVQTLALIVENEKDEGDDGISNEVLMLLPALIILPIILLVIVRQRKNHQRKRTGRSFDGEITEEN